MRFPHIIRPPVALAPHHRYRAENQQHRHQQPRSAELVASSCMAQSDSEPCTQRQPAAPEQQQPAAACATASEERAPAAETSEYQAPPRAETRPEPVAEAEKKTKKAAEGSSGGCCGGEPSRRPAEESARERLKRHRTEMAGRVRIPDMWGQERLLKDWVDCAVFDRPLAATAGLLNARDALVAECVAARRPAGHGATGRPLRVQNGCS